MLGLSGLQDYAAAYRRPERQGPIIPDGCG